jgi:hypothetical protein
MGPGIPAEFLTANGDGTDIVRKHRGGLQDLSRGRRGIHSVGRTSIGALDAVRLQGGIVEAGAEELLVAGERGVDGLAERFGFGGQRQGFALPVAGELAD